MTLANPETCRNRYKLPISLEEDYRRTMPVLETPVIPPSLAAKGYYPSAPKTVEDLNIPETLLADLVLRRLLVEGNSSLGKLSRALRLTWNVVEAAFRHLRGQQLIEVKGMAGNDYNFCLSATGRQLASERFQVSQYAGACPVSLWDYHQATKAQIAKVKIDRTKLKRAYADLVVSDRMLDQIGPAIIAQSSIFMYGPSGNGKTSLAERMLRVYDDTVLIPYAVEVDSQIVSLFDPVVHHPVENQDENMDQRWIRCKRPFVVVGGRSEEHTSELQSH